jgi:hypothetical protein
MRYLIQSSAMAISNNLHDTSLPNEVRGTGASFNTKFSDSYLVYDWIQFNPCEVIFVRNAVMEKRFRMMIVDCDPISGDGKVDESTIEVREESAAWSNVLILVAESQTRWIVKGVVSGGNRRNG